MRPSGALTAPWSPVSPLLERMRILMTLQAGAVRTDAFVRLHDSVDSGR